MRRRLVAHVSCASAMLLAALPLAAAITTSSGPIPLAPVVPPDSPQYVLWDQPLSAVNQNAYVDQNFTDFAAYSSYLADDFVADDAWSIDSIYIPGGGWNGFTTIATADSLTWTIYADAGGVPAGDPSGAGNPPLWTLTLLPSDSQVAISTGSGALPSDVELSLTTPLSLPAGHYWLIFYPTASFATWGQYGRQPADTTNGYGAQFVNPGGGFGYGTAWQGWGVVGATESDMAFRISGQVVLQSDLSIPTLSTLGLALLAAALVAGGMLLLARRRRAA